jgi:inorganic pyrophosphatase
MNIWHDMSKERVTEDSFWAVIEIEKGGKNKYELDKETGHLMLDRVLHTSTHYPANYGFIPRTYAQDGDPLDVLVLCSESILPMTMVECYPIGVIKMIDDGSVDEKIIAVCKNDPYHNSFSDVSELPTHLFTEIKHFYEVYKMLEYKETIVNKVESNNEAKKVICDCIKAYENKFGK